MEPGSIPAPNSGSFENNKIQVAKWGTQKIFEKNTLKKVIGLCVQSRQRKFHL
jgi:hypothetical protein